MTWFKVDDDFHDHPKVKAIPRRVRPAAVGLWTMAGTWCARHLTDGAVPRDQVEDLGCRLAEAAELVKVGLWLETDDGFQYHDWAKFQPTRAQVLAKREEARKRMAAARHAKDQKEKTHVQ